MDLSYKREVTVGSLVILAVVLFIVGTSWLSGRSIAANEDEFWKIQFKTAGNLKASSVVRISGVTVGKVERIQLVDVGKVLVMVTLPDRIVPRVDATAQIVAVGFVGDAAIEFNPGTAGQRLTRDKVIVGSQAGGLTDLAETLGRRADSVLIGAQEIMSEQMADELQATLTALQSTLKAAERTMRVYGDADKGPTGQITKTLASLERLTNRFDSTLGSPTLARTLGRADTLTGNLATMTAQLTATGARLDTVLLNMNQGRGTIGKFATDTGLYTDLRAVSHSLKALLDDLKAHPGKIPVTVEIF
ncbi:MAG TPA: MlaD family protein [Gemmatimonadales bacterium]|jgi:ABC-type transport system involved in resistance to organic solvents, periplasmic component